MKGKTVNEIKIGQKATFEKTITEADVCIFAGISGDLNPLHINDEEAKKSLFKSRIVHGMLVSSFISTVIGMSLPGNGTIYLSQSIKFLSPVRINDTIKAEVEIIEIDVTKNIVRLKTICSNQLKINVIEGEAVVKPPKF